MTTKKSFNLVVSRETTLLSLRRDEFNLQILHLVTFSGKDNVKVMGWWSDKTIDSIVVVDK